MIYNMTERASVALKEHGSNVMHVHQIPAVLAMGDGVNVALVRVWLCLLDAVKRKDMMSAGKVAVCLEILWAETGISPEKWLEIADNFKEGENNAAA